MRFRCSLGCKVKHKRIAVLDHGWETHHPILVETTNRGRRSILRGLVVTHDPAKPGYDK